MDYKQNETIFQTKKYEWTPSFVIYDGECICEQTYISETRGNVELQWEEHENTSKYSETAKDLQQT